MNRKFAKRCVIMVALAGCGLAMAGTPEQGGASRGGVAPAQSDGAAVTGARKAWERFLAEAEYVQAYAAFDVLPQLGLSPTGIDPAKCGTHIDALREAVKAAPVSIALRRAAMHCAEAVGDAAWAEQEMQALAGLLQLAMAQLSELEAAPPIRVLAPVDIYEFLRAAGLEWRYEYYPLAYPRRHFPLRVATWDIEAQRERHLQFDYIDVVHATVRTHRHATYPYLRRLLAADYLNRLKANDDVPALDILAVREASQLDVPIARVKVLRPVAERGGIQAMRDWLVACTGLGEEGCGSGLFEALLGPAEQLHALPMALLAYAYGEGVGTAPDSDAARKLLEAADARWPGERGTLAYVRLWVEANDAPLPAWLQDRLTSAHRRGNPEALVLTLAHALDRDDQLVLSTADIAALGSGQLNGAGQGAMLLSRYYHLRDDAIGASDWDARAAEAGDPEAQAWLASSMEGPQRSGPRRPLFLQRLQTAAQGGEWWSARQLAGQHMEAGEWVAAEGWLLEPSARGDIQAILSLAHLYEWGFPGVPAQTDVALNAYRSLAEENDSAPARRRLADMAMEGRGMDKDLAQARRWLEVDAERADPSSQAKLGLALLQGDLGDVDRTEGMRWLQSALEAKDPDAIVGYGNWLYYREDTPQSRLQALEVWSKGDALKVETASNNLAWALCTSPDPAVFDGRRGQAIMAALDDDQLDAGVIDTLAACHAAAGDFAAAEKAQLKALGMLEGERRRASGDAEEAEAIERTAAEFNRRLELYRGRKHFLDTPDA